MASETVKKILEAESEAEKKMSEAKARRDDIISSAQGKAAHTVQKSLSEAAKESGEIKAGFGKKLSAYREEAERGCEDKLKEVRSRAEKNMDKAIDAIIGRYF